MNSTRKMMRKAYRPLPDAGISLRPLGLDDIPEAQRIGRAAYGVFWTETDLQRELAENRLARYLAVSDGNGTGLRGFAGMWCLVDEAHILTVAVEPEQQGGGVGGLLVHGLVAWAMREGMEVATLEVRPTNVAARALYRRYGFWDVGERKRYYPDGADAVIMTTEGLTTTAYRARWAALEAGIARRFPALVVERPIRT